MKAIQIRQFGGPEVMSYEEVAQPTAQEGELLIRVQAAGVGPWDAWVRAGKSVIPQKPPLVLGAEVSGVVVAMGAGIDQFQVGNPVYGALNSSFTGGYAQYARGVAKKISIKPKSLDDVEAASVPVVAVTAYQMLFEHAKALPGQRVLIHGAAGNVGSYAVQLAKIHGARVFATASANDVEFVRGLGAEQVIDYHGERFEDRVKDVDVAVDTVGGKTQERTFRVMRPQGILISAVSPPPKSSLRNIKSGPNSSL